MQFSYPQRYVDNKKYTASRFARTSDISSKTFSRQDRYLSFFSHSYDHREPSPTGNYEDAL